MYSVRNLRFNYFALLPKYYNDQLKPGAHSLISSHHIHLHSTHKTKHSTCRYTHPGKVSETQSYQNRPYFSIRDETASYVMNVIACPGIMRISRGVIPFHKAGVPSSLAMTMQDCNRLLYCVKKWGTVVTYIINVNEEWHDNGRRQVVVETSVPLALFPGGWLAFAYVSWPRLWDQNNKATI